MTNSKTDLDELDALQREAAALRSEREQADSTAAPAVGQGAVASGESTSQEEGLEKPAQAAKRTTRTRSTGSAASRKKTSVVDSKTDAEPSAAAAPLEEATPESVATLEDLNVDFNGILKDMEDAARERPVLALLAAFSLGIVVGQMFSRR